MVSRRQVEGRSEAALRTAAAALTLVIQVSEGDGKHRLLSQDGPILPALSAPPPGAEVGPVQRPTRPSHGLSREPPLGRCQVDPRLNLTLRSYVQDRHISAI